MNNQSVALQLAKAGLRVFPCRPKDVLSRTGEVLKKTKAPFTENGFKNACSDPNQVGQWWRENPDAIVGLELSSAGLFVVDCDIGKVDGIDGVANFFELAEKNGGIEGAPSVRTPGGGLHFYFKQPHGEPLGISAGKIAPGIDTRGHGGYIIAPNSVMPDGRRYQPHTEILFDRLHDLPEVPDWIVELVRKPKSNGQTNGHAFQSRGAGPREQKYALAALQNIYDEVAGAAKGQRNHQLNRSAFSLGTMVGAGWISEGVARAALIDAGLRCGLDRCETENTVASGLSAGIAKPHAPLEEKPKKTSKANASEKSSRSNERPWLQNATLDEEGRPYANVANALAILRAEPEVKSSLKYDQMLCAPLLTAPLPASGLGQAEKDFSEPRPVHDADATKLQEFIQHIGLPKMGKDTVQSAIDVRAQETKFHPIRDYLDGLKWDGTERLSEWLPTYLGVKKTDYSKGIGRMFLISMVARVNEPGCKCDSGDPGGQSGTTQVNGVRDPRGKMVFRQPSSARPQGQRRCAALTWQVADRDQRAIGIFQSRQRGPEGLFDKEGRAISAELWPQRGRSASTVCFDRHDQRLQVPQRPDRPQALLASPYQQD
jgi:hypothetical protein